MYKVKSNNLSIFLYKLDIIIWQDVGSTHQYLTVHEV